MLSTLNRCREYKGSNEDRVAKLIPRYDGPYKITDLNNEASVVELNILSTPNIFPKFHTSLIKPFRQNNNSKFPSRTLEVLGPMEVDGEQEFFINWIIDHRKVGCSYKYLVWWAGKHAGGDRWITERSLVETEALEKYWKDHPDQRHLKPWGTKSRLISFRIHFSFCFFFVFPFPSLLHCLLLLQICYIFVSCCDIFIFFWGQGRV